MSEYVNDYFSNVTARLGVTNISPNNSFLRFLNPVVNSIFMLPSSDFEISNIINSLPLKNTSFDDIPVKILRLISVPLSCWLSAIYNHCLNLGFYPSLLKTARVIPIFKGGNSANVSNYRPISNLLTINKIFEKLTFNRINNFFESGKIISENQHGFRKGRNTTTAILQLINNLLNGFHNKKYTVCIFLDLRKAFDCVNHSILLNKLFTYGVRGGAYKLVESYLSNRSQYSEVNNNVSTIKTIKTGVPQGSILGPLLFNAFINDIVSLKDVEVALYADDAVFYMNDESMTELILRLNKFLDSLSEWLKLNLLVPNTEKTVLMLFTPFATPTLPDVIFMGKKLEWVSEIKYLGMHLDNKLLFSTHINYICNKISIGQGIIYSLSHYLPTKILLSLYYTLIYPHINLNIVIWGGTSESRLKKVRVAMNNVFRSILSIGRDENNIPNRCNNYLYKTLNVLKFDDVYLTNMILFIHSILYGQNSNLFYDFIGRHLPQRRYGTRNSRLNIPSIRLKIEKQSTFYNTIKIFNDMPPEFLEPQSRHSLKKKCKVLALQNY